MEGLSQLWENGQFLQHIVTQIDSAARLISYNVSLAIPKGENYCSQLYRININYKLNDISFEKLFIFKVFPKGDYVQRYVRETNLFETEKRVYYETIPAFSAFHPIKFVVKCFPQNMLQNILVFQDVCHEGFRLAPRNTQLNYAHSKLAIMILAQFHAVSFIYNLKFPNSLQDSYAENIYVDDKDIARNYCLSSFETLTEVVSSWTEAPTIRFGPKMKALSETYWKKIIDVIQPNKKSFNVLNHGDYWINNIMFKYNKDHVVQEALMLDFQVCRFGSPALDILFFMHSSVQNVEDCYDALLEDYGNSFRRTLTRNNYSENLYQHNVLKEELRERSFFGFVAACSVLSAVVAKGDNVIDLTKLSEEAMKSEENPLLRIYWGEHFKRIFVKKLKYFENIGVL